ncbi:MAG: malate dehydrogenase [Omnitrophica WOR_2 bacterium RIFCSPHIGHO2_02_FULL_45_21]|nr:MAG: malate dehydrogenase [Omnitrophica WOR_2 bacterium RIFCSPHIGHO2_02_FULL_45_21]
MQKIVIIGAGNVGGQIALFLINEAPAHIILLDVVIGLGKGKALDLEDAAGVLKADCIVEGSDDFSLLKHAEIIVITAGLARQPGMQRDDLLRKNSEIIRDISLKIKEFAKNPIIIVVTNPVDLMTYLVSRLTGFDKKRVFGMGISLDAARFANLIRQSLNVPLSAVEAVVMGSHGQTMVPVASLSMVSGAQIERLINPEIVAKLARATVERGASIVAHLGSGSAYFGPAAAVCNIIRAIAKDEKRIIGVCAYLNGEYGINRLYIGVPARIGQDGVEAVIELKLSKEEKEAFVKSCDSIRQQINNLAI